jgi:hypothetical protein
MSTVPRDVPQNIEFYELRVGTGKPWTDSTTEIGLEAGDVTNLNTKIVAARAAYTAALALRNQAKAATFTLKQAIEEMTRAGSDCIKKIKGAASQDPSIYAIAEIPAPATPSPVGAPGKPSNFKVTLSETGELILGWTNTNPRGGGGTVYQVSRKLPGGDFVIIGSTGQKKFTDSTLPANAGPVTYRVVGQRSTVQGEAAQFTVSFGVGSGGEMTATIAAAGAAPKLAA